VELVHREVKIPQDQVPLAEHFRVRYTVLATTRTI
jgi:hypothetical protein